MRSRLTSGADFAQHLPSRQNSHGSNGPCLVSLPQRKNPIPEIPSSRSAGLPPQFESTETGDGQTGLHPAIYALCLTVFGLVTAEFLPVSILTSAATDLGGSNGTVGQSMTATAVIAAIMGPVLVLWSGLINRRLIVLALVAIQVLSCLLAANAQNIETLIVARALLGVSVGGSWALMASLALRLAPAKLVPRAIATISTGVAAATVVAAPVGSFVGSI